MRAVAALLLSLLSPALLASARVTMSVDYPQVARPDDILTINAFIHNSGPDTAQNVVVTLGVPPGVSTVGREIPADWNCAIEGDAIVCRVASVAVSTEGQPPDVRLTFLIALNPHGSGRYQLPLTVTADNATGPDTQMLQLDVIRAIGVNNTSDSGPGSLRQALIDVNETCDAAVCEIGIGLSDGSVIAPLTPLPAITSCGDIRIVAGPSFPAGPLPVELAGAHLQHGNGLEVRARCTSDTGYLRVWGLAINGFPDDGVSIAPETSNHETSLSNLAIGTDRTGLEARPNGSRGVTIHAPDARLLIGACVISGNTRSGIYITNTARTMISGSFIGVGSDGVRPIGNGASGIFVRRGRVETYGNTIANNRHWGVALAPGAQAAVLDNASIRSNGILGIDWGLNGRTHDTDETGAPNTPVITEAIFDAASNTTIVRGTIEIHEVLGELYSVLVYSSDGRNQSGEVEGETREYPYGRVQFHGGTPGIVAWEARIPRDLRGKYVTAISGVALFNDLLPYASSEFSEALTVQ